MRSNDFTLKQRFTVIIFTMGILLLAFMATAVNQLKKIKAYNELSGKTIALSEQINTLDSLQKVLFARLPYDINFFQSQKSTIADKISKYIDSYSNEVTAIGNSYYLHHNKDIRLKTYEIGRIWRDYRQNLAKYLELVNQKGY
ncbi:MAG TPA: hypothetical protein PLF75_11450, partial [Bacteroidales bacterium]|nr:hypothetical protein [Bacteroidales bacterium]